MVNNQNLATKIATGGMHQLRWISVFNLASEPNYQPKLN